MNLRKIAKGQKCQVRIPGVCNGDPETTVLAHLNGGGMGRKHPDLIACFSCSSCHSWLDVAYVVGHTRADRDLCHLQAIIRTQQKLLDMGLQGAIDAWRELDD